MSYMKYQNANKICSKTWNALPYTDPGMSSLACPKLSVLIRKKLESLKQERDYELY